jgi:hypothetical protein
MGVVKIKANTLVPYRAILAWMVEIRVMFHGLLWNS